MIQVTLTFISLDAMIGALREIPESSLVSTSPTTREVAAAPVEKPSKSSKAAAPTSAETTPAPAPTPRTAAVDAGVGAQEKTAVASIPTAEPAEAAPQASTAADKVDYPTLQKAVFTLAGKSREAAAALAQSFGVKTFKELPETKWAEALKAVQTKTAELEAA